MLCTIQSTTRFIQPFHCSTVFDPENAGPGLSYLWCVFGDPDRTDFNKPCWQREYRTTRTRLRRLVNASIHNLLKSLFIMSYDAVVLYGTPYITWAARRVQPIEIKNILTYLKEISCFISSCFCLKIKLKNRT